MKKMAANIVLLFFSCTSPLLFGHDVYNFDPQEIVRKQSMPLIQARFGSEFKYVGYTLIDSLLRSSKIEGDDHFQDPYSTLKGCILFSTYKDYKGSEPYVFIIGMIKNGKIIWDNSPGTQADLGSKLLYTQDINNDGEVDLIFITFDRKLALIKGPDLYYDYVFSWNGTHGRFINTFRKDGKSAMISEDLLELEDKDNDGIKEISASLPSIDMDFSKYRSEIFPRIIYSWNGKQYGFWPQAKQKK